MSDKSQIKREELKVNYLKKTIIRLDYDKLFDENIEELVEKIYPNLIAEKYKMDSRTFSEFKIDMNDFEPKENNIRINKVNQEVYSSFLDETKTIRIDITKKYIAMTVSYNNYKKFDELIKVFNKLIEEVKKIRNGISLNRIGIRKTNVYFMKNIEKINDYFEEYTFSINKKIDLAKKQLTIKNDVESFETKKNKVNLTKNISKGESNNNVTKKSDVIYQIILDIDVYNDNVENNEINLEQINEELFDVYKSALKLEFLNNLKNEEYKDEELIKL